ncbi:MAG: Xaa-Pro dipeptidase [Pseudomonadota bacterium]
MVPQLAELYREHVARLVGETSKALEDTGWDGLLIHSGRLQRRSSFDDQDCPLRVMPAFLHWLPLMVPDCLVVVVPGKRPQLLHNTAHSYWEGRTVIESEHFWECFEVFEVSEPAQAKNLIPAVARLAFIGDNAERAAFLGIPKEAINPEALLSRLDAVRSVKSPYEVACMSEANRRAAPGYRQVVEAFRAGEHSELELHLMYLQATRQDDPDTPFKGIVALGKNAAVLHHVRYGREPSRRQADSLLVDAGATCLGYCSDITRTVVKGNTGGAKAFAALVEGMEKVQRTIRSRIAVGIPFEDLHDQTHWLIASLIRELGIAKASEDELVVGGATRKFLPHGLGHSLGIQTHDVGCLVKSPKPENRFLRNTSITAAGQVVTIEPGFYFIEELLGELKAGPIGDRIAWDLVAELSLFGGVRIEDDMHVAATSTTATTTDGCGGSGSGSGSGGGGARNLTREHLP